MSGSGFDEETSRLMKEALNEVGDKYSNVYKNFNSQFESIQQRMTSHIENKCNKEYTELKKNRDKKFYNKYFEIFQDCANKNDFGLNNLIKDVMSQQDHQNSIDHNCIVKCRINNFERENKKMCLKKCLVESAENLVVLYEKVTIKTEEINSKI